MVLGGRDRGEPVGEFSSFNLNVAGRNLSPSSATFTTSPTAQFQYGELVGITFAVNTSTLSGFPYTAVSMSGMTVAAQTAGGTLSATAALQNFVTLDFNGITAPPTAGYSIIVTWKLKDGTTDSFSFKVFPGATGESIRDTVASDLKDQGLNPEKSGTTGLIVKGTGMVADKQLTELKITADNMNFTPPKKVAARGVDYNP